MCLKNYIGFKWCKAETPESGMWLNTLPGISLKSIDNLANEEQITFLGVWNDVQERAITRLNTFVQNHFAKRYKLNTVIDSVALGRDVDTVNNQTAAVAEYRGVTIDLGSCASPLSRIYVQSVSVYVGASATVDIKVYELNKNYDGPELFSVNRTLNTGWNTILINKTFEAQKIFIGYDAATVNSVYSAINSNYPATCGSNCDACVNIGNCKAYIRGAAYLPTSSLTTHNNSFGLSGVFGAQCSFDALVCANKNVFKTALWYLSGAEAMFERMYSDRLNRYTTVDRKLAEELYAKYIKEADSELKNAIEGIQLDCDCCISAQGRVTVVDNLP